MPHTPAPVPSRPYGRTIAALVAATFTVFLNETIMINAIPRLMADFHVDARAAQWLSTAFMLAMAVVIPVTGWLLQRVRTRALFLTAMSIFICGTVLAAAAWSFPVLVAARVVQAGGTAIMMPLLMTTLMSIVPADERGKVMGNVTMAISVAPALGPTASGLVLDFMSWRWIFLLVLPFAVVVTAAGLRFLDDVGEPRALPLDWVSVPLAAVGFGGLVYGLSQLGAGDAVLPVDPWWMVAGGLAAIAVFAWRQVRLAREGSPLLNLSTLAIPRYTHALALMAAAFMAMLGAMILLPLYLQDVRGLSTLATGLMLMPGGLAMGLLGPTVGKLYDRYGARVLVLPGAIGCTLLLAVLARVDMHTPYWVILADYTAMLVCLSFVFTPVFTLGLGALPAQLYSHGSSLLGTVQQLAAAAGAALVVTVMSSHAGDLVREGHSGLDAMAGGMRWAFGLAALISLTVLVLAATLPSGRGAGAHAAHGAHDVPEPAVDAEG